MTLQTKYGPEKANLNDMDNEILTTKKGDDVKVGKEKFTGFKGKEKWEGANIQAESTPLIDPGTGEPIIIRTFMFKFNPEWIKKNKGVKNVNKQELFNNHWKFLQLELWKDGLTPNEGVEPKMTFKKGHYFIQLTCRARLGVMVADSPETLNKILARKGA